MTVHERNGRIIVDTIWPDGKRTRRQAIDVKQARELDLRIRASRIDGTWRELRRKLNAEHAEGMKLREAADLYLDQYVRSKNRDRKSKKSRLAILVRELGNLLISEIGRAEASRYSARRLKAGISARTVNRDLAVLRHLLEWCRRQQILEANPLHDWERLVEQPFEGRRPTGEIVDQVIARVRETVRPLFIFLRETGCRREEGLALKHSQVDLRNAVVHLHRTKSGKPRSVPLTAAAIAAIRQMPRTSRTEYVFYHPATLTRWSEAKDPWESARKAAGHPWLRIHDLRHAYAIRLVEAGVPMEVVSEMLGHATIDFTKKTYAKYAPTWAGRVVLAALEGRQVEVQEKVRRR